MKHYSRRDFLKITAVAGTALAGAGWFTSRTSAAYTLTQSRSMMGTIIQLTLIADSREQAEAAAETTFAQMEHLVSLFNYRDPASPLSRLNAAGVLADPPPELVELLQQSLRISALSEGAFDVTIKPLVDAYRQGRQPSTSELALVDYRKLKVAQDEVRLETPGMQLTLDGIAKGYIVDGGVAALAAAGFGNLIVEAGGDLVVSGHPPARTGWQIGVAHPRPEKLSGYLASFTMGRGAAATSGDYLESFRRDHSLHHIIDPRSGTSPPELASVTVVAASAARADALSTTIMVLGAERGLKLSDRLDGIETMTVSKQLRIRRTAGFPKSDPGDIGDET